MGSYGSYGRERVIDVVRALAAYRGEALPEHAEFRKLDDLHGIWGHQAGEVVFDGSHYVTVVDGVEKRAPDRGITIRKFKNGNAHMIFTPEALLEINRGLAEFYGDVLPDVEEPDAVKRPGTELAKDLQFYWTPPKVIDTVLYDAGIYTRDEVARGYDRRAFTVLEPSCGDGRIMDALRERGCRAFGIEVHAGRAQEARAKGHNVLVKNFLEVHPSTFPPFDFVVMNPPFYGRHYVKHVRHAMQFLKPGGTLVAILPATARYDHDDLADLMSRTTWRDHPVASFAPAGTNVPTGHLIISIRSPR